MRIKGADGLPYLIGHSGFDMCEGIMRFGSEMGFYVNVEDETIIGSTFGRRKIVYLEL